MEEKKEEPILTLKKKKKAISSEMKMEESVQRLEEKKMKCLVI